MSWRYFSLRTNNLKNNREGNMKNNKSKSLINSFIGVFAENYLTTKSKPEPTAKGNWYVSRKHKFSWFIDVNFIDLSALPKCGLGSTKMAAYLVKPTVDHHYYANTLFATQRY